MADVNNIRISPEQMETKANEFSVQWPQLSSDAKYQR